MIPSPEADSSTDGALVVRAVGMDAPGTWLFRVSWRQDGEQVSHATTRPEEVHELVDAWLLELRRDQGAAEV